MINHDYLIALTENLADVQKEEYQQFANLTQAKLNLEEARALSLSLAYHNGEIVGKNTDERQRKETVFLSNDDAYQAALQNENKIDKYYQMAKIERQRIENEISLTKAWLYSQRGSDV